MKYYADYITMYCNIDQNNDEDTIHNELSNIWKWLAPNILSLNMSKNKINVFATSARDLYIQPLLWYITPSEFYKLLTVLHFGKLICNILLNYLLQILTTNIE